MKQYQNALIVKLGGSVIVPYDIDTKTIKNIINITKKHVAQNDGPVLFIIGGGQVNRWYNSRLDEWQHISATDKDWMGIYAIRYNAEFIRLTFGDMAHPQVINDPEKLPKRITKPVVICGAASPGHSSNFDSVVFAEQVSAKRIINLSNQPFVYSSDPRYDPLAIPYSEMTWHDYLKIIPKEWSPKLSTPFDPIASRRASFSNIQVWFVAGSNMESVASAFAGKHSHGTILGAKTTTVYTGK